MKVIKSLIIRLANLLRFDVKLFLASAFVLIALFVQVVTGRFKADSFVLLTV